MGQFGAGLVGHYKSGYVDQDEVSRVASYTTFDAFGTWAPTKSWSLIVGVRNLTDRDPPFTMQDEQLPGRWLGFPLCRSDRPDLLRAGDLQLLTGVVC